MFNLKSRLHQFGRRTSCSNCKWKHFRQLLQVIIFMLLLQDWTLHFDERHLKSVLVLCRRRAPFAMRIHRPLAFRAQERAPRSEMCCCSTFCQIFQERAVHASQESTSRRLLLAVSSLCFHIQLETEKWDTARILKNCQPFFFPGQKYVLWHWLNLGPSAEFFATEPWPLNGHHQEQPLNSTINSSKSVKGLET